jgi:hypothetical protein
VKKYTGEMVLLASEADLDEDLSIPVSTLQRFPHFRILTNRTNSIISSNALVGEGAFIKDCLLGHKFNVLPAARHVNEHLTVVEETLFEA